MLVLPLRQISRLRRPWFTATSASVIAWATSLRAFFTKGLGSVPPAAPRITSPPSSLPDAGVPAPTLITEICVAPSLQIVLWLAQTQMRAPVGPIGQCRHSWTSWSSCKGFALVKSGGSDVFVLSLPCTGWPIRTATMTGTNTNFMHRSFCWRTGLIAPVFPMYTVPLNSGRSAQTPGGLGRLTESRSKTVPRRNFQYRQNYFLWRQGPG